MQLTDQYNRKVNYLRISVTDRCDLRCVYCMKEKMTFLPKKEILTLEEIERLCDNFIEMGVKKIRLTGGEPLVRKDIIKLINKINGALKRIDDGSYGYCKETGEPIEIKRLEARPVAALSLEAQEIHEKKEKK